ncbi:olfactory receptor 52J3-like [Ara ararauna]
MWQPNLRISDERNAEDEDDADVGDAGLKYAEDEDDADVGDAVLQHCLVFYPNHSSPLSFIPTGIPGLEDVQFWNAFPFCTMYFVAVLGNITLLLVIRMDPHLHLPVFYFLSMLAAIDLVLITSTMPKLLSIFWFRSHDISFKGCMAPMFFIHSFSTAESGVLLTMALDQYLAISGSGCCMHGVLVITPLTCIVTTLSYCGPRIIPHSYCRHMSVVKLACGDIRPNSIYGIMAATIMGGHTGLSSMEACLKSFGTCGSYTGVILLFYLPELFSFYTQHWGQSIPVCLHILVAALYLMVLPMTSPLIYDMRPTWERVLSLL